MDVRVSRNSQVHGDDPCNSVTQFKIHLDQVGAMASWDTGEGIAAVYAIAVPTTVDRWGILLVAADQNTLFFGSNLEPNNTMEATLSEFQNMSNDGWVSISIASSIDP